MSPLKHHQCTMDKMLMQIQSIGLGKHNHHWIHVLPTAFQSAVPPPTCPVLLAVIKPSIYETYNFIGFFPLLLGQSLLVSVLSIRKTHNSSLHSAQSSPTDIHWATFQTFSMALKIKQKINTNHLNPTWKMPWPKPYKAMLTASSSYSG